MARILSARLTSCLIQVDNASAQADGHGQWAHRWQAGDIYVEQVRVDLPANLATGEYQLKVGLFDGIHQQNFDFTTPQGAQATFDIPVTIAAR